MKLNFSLLLLTALLAFALTSPLSSANPASKESFANDLAVSLHDELDQDTIDTVVKTLSDIVHPATANITCSFPNCKVDVNINGEKKIFNGNGHALGKGSGTVTGEVHAAKGDQY